MTLEKSELLLKMIESSNLQKQKVDLYESFLEYARIRADWFLLPLDEKFKLEALRTTTHNTLIDCCNILSRNMIKKGEDATWRLELGNDRKEIGDFACFVHLLFGLKSR